MPFDHAGFFDKPEPPKRPVMSDNTATVLIIVFAATLLVMPISLAAFVDIVLYWRGS